jgi:hypothetical protein
MGASSTALAIRGFPVPLEQPTQADAAICNAFRPTRRILDFSGLKLNCCSVVDAAKPDHAFLAHWLACRVNRRVLSKVIRIESIYLGPRGQRGERVDQRGGTLYMGAPVMTNTRSNRTAAG